MGRRPLCLLCSLLMVFLFFLHLFGVPLLPDPPGAERADAYLDTPYTVTVTGRVVSSEAQEDYSICILKQTVLSVKSEKFKLNRVRLSFKIPRHYAVGTVISARGILEKVTGATNPGQFDKTLYYRVQNIGYTMKNPDVTVLNPSCDYLLEGLALLREAAVQRIRTVYPADVSGVLGAMLTGSRSMLLSFYEIPLYGILINFAAVPLLPFVLGFGILGTVLGGVFV